MKKERMPKDLKSYLEDYIERYFLNTDMAITGMSLGGISISPEVGVTLEHSTIELEDGWQFIKENTDSREKGKENIIEVQKEVQIGNIILEKGDRIRILSESDMLKYYNKIDINLNKR